jgi:hypothetical protein
MNFHIKYSVIETAKAYHILAFLLTPYMLSQAYWVPALKGRDFSPAVSLARAQRL